MLVVSSWVGLSLALLLTNSVRGEILTPPYFNLAEGKKIYASATCGEDTEGPELYCKLVGANSENDGNFNLIQGQFCDICDPSRPDKMHPPEFAVDGMETWWQSPPLSRGMKYNEVNLTIDLGQEFHVAYVFIRMGNSPRPGLWILEKSSDYGKTFKPWQYFSDSTGDCEAFFGRDSLQPISKDDSVICSTEYSKIVPLEGGEIPISLLNNRPSAMNYFNSSVLQDWTRATNVRFRFLRTKNLLGHLMSVARQDPTVTRRYFYSIKDISIGGRCMCNGHADSCDNQDISDPIVLICRCQHNTCGSKCETCCPGYEQKAWRISKSYKPFVCEPCNCFLHSNECVYDEEVDKKHLSLDIHGNYEGGGVCQNCQHNTEGVNCNRCKSTFYRPHNKHWNETDACQPCNCDMSFSTGNCEEGTGRCECRKEFTEPDCKSCSFGYYDYPKCKPCECFRNGTVGLQCEPSNGDCPCKENFGGKYCKECSPEYFNFPECIRCECNPAGSISSECDQTTGNCTCKSNYGTKHCDQCQDGYFNYPNCLFCNCDVKGTKEGICDKETGKCWCKLGYGGARCDQCIPGYYGYPDCKPCNCSSVGSASTVCDASGKCPCLVNFAGRTCNQCSPGYYKFPECLACNCDSHGGNGISCDGEGRCQCFNNFDGNRCDQCKEGFYNFPSCEDCNCHPAGVVESFAGCGSVPAGELCQCKERVEGRICNKCKPLYWNLIPSNPDGCEECKCDLSGTLGGIAVCDTESGQCTCKPSVVSRSCAECQDGTYNLQKDNLFGCTDCGCDIGGSLSPFCDKTDGQCICQSRVTGRTCNEPIQTHYFPTLYQYQYEVEDGRTPQMTSVRYSYNSNDFPHYSWRGYAVFNNLQNEILQDIYIFKPSVYIMVLRYVNSNPDTVIGTIKITPDNPSDIEQKLQVQFKNSSTPASVVVSGATGIVSKPFVLNPGRWTASIKIDRDLLVDYFVLLPEEFYLATILKQNVDNPCNVDEQGLCRDFSYPNISQYDVTWGGGAYIDLGNNYAQPTEYFKDHEHLTQLSVRKGVIPLINNNQQEIDYHLMLSKPGHYVILINYITPKDDLRTHLVDVDVITNTTNPGKIPMYSCIYSSMCRQVVTTKNDKVGVYQVEGNDLKIKLRGNDANVGIHSIVAIPYEDWSMDFIQPRPVCIRKDGQCVKSSFLNPPESKKIQFEQEMDGSEGHTLPPVIVQNTTSYVFLSPKDRMIDLKGKVPEPGQYVFVVHYTQPDFPEFNLDVLIQNGQFYDAKLPVQHCPSVSGCRALIIQEDGNTQFSLTENFMITHKLPHNENVYLDYLLVVPADVYSQQILREEELNRASEFIVNCGSNHFNIDTSENGFCRDSVFTITAGYNNGALPCNCDYDGSLSFECEKFGGQCQCKPNMIGRQCSSCKTGYYGFPDCQPCNCPSTAYCEPATGVCICPRNVMGKLCDQCEPLTYGFHPLIGCEECNCNPLGIKNTLQCDLFNGSCPCKENIVGRKCDICQAGYYLYPHCDKCACDIRGTTEEICDQESAECLCKKNLVGPLCSICREGTFNLQASNTDGCTDCFCFGKTTRCHSSNLARTAIFHMSNWTVIAINETDKIDFIPLNLTLENIDEYNVILEFSNELKNKTVYFAVPITYLGKKITSYGGNLKYSIFYTIGESGKAVMGPDVILVGGGTYLTYNSIEQPAASTDYTESLELVEANFILPSGLPANREHIMVVLEDLQGIYIRAIYWSASYSTKISNVFLDDAVDSRIYGDNYQNLEIASSVEQCLCPPNYQGLSCEECAPGHYRISSGPHGGYCVPCQCNGHTDECDVNTGICINCQHSTTGQHCEKCDIGYHGNAVQGTPRDCLICACPLPIASNNFATGCDVSSDGEKISCDCVEGYFGARCQSCAPGYYGKPELLEDYCKPCQCSGNINPDEHGSCDTVTGECMRCLNNTFGEACALCAPGYFGDAITLKDCQSCVCDIVGTDHCDSYNGECQCKPNVIGEKCDRCELEHYGFQSGSGCIACNCEVASTSDQCDDVTGQCRCKVGVTGRNCDRCAPGFWNYTIDGCISCGCKTQYSLGFGCNAQTGQCECLTGVIGEKCDQCPHRWAFVKDYGCHKCDSCTHDLLDTVDMLANLIDPVISDFDSADSGFFTARRLIHITETFQHLKPRILQLDPNSINLTPIIQELESLEQDSMNMNRKANYSLDNSKTLVTDAKGTRKETDEVLTAVYEAAQQVRETIDNIKQLSLNLSTGEGPKIDAALQEAEAILNDLQLYNLTEPKNIAEKEFDKVENLIDSLLVYKLPVDQVDTEIKIIKDGIKDFNEKLDDLYNHTQYSINKAKEADSLYAANGKERVEKKLANIVNQTMAAENNLKTAEELLTNASRYFNNAKDSYAVISKQADLLEKPNNLLNTTLETTYNKLTDLETIVPAVQDHASNLSRRAEELVNILTETQGKSDNALRAANAYNDIGAAIEEAQEAAKSSKEFVDNASLLYGELQIEIADASTTSDSILDDADAASRNIEELKPKIKEVENKSRKIRSLHSTNEDQVNNIERFIKGYQVHPFNDLLLETINITEKADGYTQNTLNIVGDSYKEVPQETDQAKKLPKKLDDANRDILQVEKHLETINEKLPKIMNALNDFPSKQGDIKGISEGIEDKIKKLNQQIAVARDMANQIKVGVKFYRNTTLELRNPPNLVDLSTSTHISGYFKTDNSDGLIVYLGNGEGTNLRRTKTDDYMALEVENGYPVLTLDIGNGPERIVNSKYVADNQWYQFIIDRNGLNAKLTIKEQHSDGQTKETVTEEDLEGPYTIFNLDRNQSKLFVGSFPPEFHMQEYVKQNSFEGEMEDLVVGDMPVSLWNFNSGYENNHGCRERDKLVNLNPSTGCRFNGYGYVILDARSQSFKLRSNIKLDFKTFASNGLLFLYGKGKTFIALEISNGTVVYKYNLGGKTKVWQTKAAYSDGKWHKIVASRDGPKGQLEVDGEVIRDDGKQISGNSIDFSDYLFFGGYPQSHNFSDVTNVDFDGCIQDVNIRGNPVDLLLNHRAYGITPGCPVKFARLVSFAKMQPGYVNVDPFYVHNNFKMTLKFKTPAKDGLIFYATDKQQTNGISLSITDGRLKLISQKIELISKDNNFNDSEWHVISIRHNHKELRLDFDDYDYKVTDSPPPMLHILYGNLFIGGLPENFVAKKGTVASALPFIGCIGDASLNGTIINFANSTDKAGDVLGRCLLDKQIDSTDIDTVPTLPPLGHLDSFTTHRPDIFTEDEYKAGLPQRGDGGDVGEEVDEFDIEETESPDESSVISTVQPITTTSLTTIQSVTTWPTPRQHPATTKAPIIVPSCALPIPESPLTYDAQNKDTKSFRFGTANYSRTEYDQARGKYRKQFDFSFDVKTNNENGLIFYAANTNQDQFVTLYIKDGHFVYMFNGGAGTATLRTELTYNDDIWHNVLISREQSDGKLVVDEILQSEGKTPNPTNKIDLNTPFFIGGIPPENQKNIFANTKMTETFQGCIRNFKMNGKDMEKTRSFNVSSCPDNVEVGTFFGRDGGYVNLKPKFKVGLEIDIKLDIKPRNLTGLLVSVYGKRDYLVLEMINGVIKFTVENGKGPISASFEPDKNNYFCDGEWHSIQAVKSKSVVTLSVDKTFTQPAIGDNRSQSTDTGGVLFLGGHRFINRARAIVARVPYVGCVKNVYINNIYVNISNSMVNGDVAQGYCPTD